MKSTFLGQQSDIPVHLRGLSQDSYLVIRKVLEVCWVGLWSHPKVTWTAKIHILACCRTDAGNLSIIEMNGEYRVLWTCHLPTELSESGMQRSGSHCTTTPKKTVQPTHRHPHDDRRSTFTFLGQDGWMMVSNRRLSFWVPPASQKAFHN
ncbi:hypothetical protein CY34DRAFT_814170, partial [Suillus luteus UH-Slu-Lm8-n1]